MTRVGPTWEPPTEPSPVLRPEPAREWRWQTVAVALLTGAALWGLIVLLIWWATGGATAPVPAGPPATYIPSYVSQCDGTTGNRLYFSSGLGLFGVAAQDPSCPLVVVE